MSHSSSSGTASTFHAGTVLLGGQTRNLMAGNDQVKRHSEAPADDTGCSSTANDLYEDTISSDVEVMPENLLGPMIRL